MRAEPTEGKDIETRQTARMRRCTMTFSFSLQRIRVSHIVSRAGGGAAAAGPVGVEELAARPIDAFVGVSAEVVAHGLQQVRGQIAVAVAVEVGECGTYRWQRPAVDHA